MPQRGQDLCLNHLQDLKISFCATIYCHSVVRYDTTANIVSLGLAARGPGRCNVNNGGCWQESRNGRSMSACVVSSLKAFPLPFPH